MCYPGRRVSGTDFWLKTGVLAIKWVSPRNLCFYANIFKNINKDFGADGKTWNSGSSEREKRIMGCHVQVLPFNVSAPKSLFPRNYAA